MLSSAAVILTEDTRHSGKLLHHYNIKTPMVILLQTLICTYLCSACLIVLFGILLQLSYHKFNESQREQTVLKRLKQGEIVALISDAGTPGISDPGTELVSLLSTLSF